MLQFAIKAWSQRSVTRTYLLRLVNVIATHNTAIFYTCQPRPLWIAPDAGCSTNSTVAGYTEKLWVIIEQSSRRVTDTVSLCSRYSTPQSSYYKWRQCHSSRASTTATMRNDQVGVYIVFGLEIKLIACAVLTTMITNAVRIRYSPLTSTRTRALPLHS